MATMDNARAVALKTLSGCLLSGRYSNIALDVALERSTLSPVDRAFCTALVYGTLEKKVRLDYYLSRLAEKTVKIEDEIRVLLCMGLYQMKYLDSVPPHAAVSTTVELAPRRAKGFVNAILRTFGRANCELPIPTKEDPVRYLSVVYSVIPALAERFLSVFGLEKAEEILAGFEQTPPLSLSVNALKLARDELLARFSEQGIDAEAAKESTGGILVHGASPVSLPGFADGLFFVQDEASRLCVEAVEAAPGMNVLDTCACPGSKSFGMAIAMKNEGRLLSCDLHENKLSLVRSGATRLGITILESRACDARELDEHLVGQFDRVLCDVPCSGFGVLAKKPELRLKDPVLSDGLPAIQGAILDTAAHYVKVGGRLIYSTCTLLPSENRGNIQAFLSDHPNYTLLRERTLYPHTDGTDGFYFAALARLS